MPSRADLSASGGAAELSCIHIAQVLLRKDYGRFRDTELAALGAGAAGELTRSILFLSHAKTSSSRRRDSKSDTCTF